ncbi:hypothetical protein KIW84_040938 [Lathyrus oleraceus]|uniref:Uncharacterized protein n=1 Tax=Pisum sativum TaxID=3888 RepID=A0A9D4X8W3_PEA|nr:hypothetical protein KIW84_040938 [Pisum sativum]
MAKRLLFNDTDHVGVFCKLTNTYCLVGEGSDDFYSEVVAKFEDIIPVIKTSIAGTSWVGRYCIGKVSLKHSNLNQLLGCDLESDHGCDTATRVVAYFFCSSFTGSVTGRFDLCKGIQSPPALRQNFTKLDEKNFHLWRQQIQPYINAHNLMDFVCTWIPPQFIDDEARTTGNVNLTYSGWLQKDQMLLPWLQLTLSNEIISRVLGCSHSHQLWDRLFNFFQKQTRGLA